MLDVEDVLDFLEVEPGAPGIRLLNNLISAYTRKVPWETVFRIVKRAETPDLARCPRWPEEFWRDAMMLGGGGTCYETSYAFFWLLSQLGYVGYLTVNDMGNQHGCHAAIVLHQREQKALVDVAIPIHAALHIDPQHATRHTTWLHTYTIQPDGPSRYQIFRSNHPKPNIYTLYDTPVPDPDYKKVVEQDYGPGGLFLDRVVVVKVIGDRLWRFNSAERPYRLESFGHADRKEVAIPEDQVAEVLEERFGMDRGKIAKALGLVENKNNILC